MEEKETEYTKFVTEYTVDGALYGSVIYAADMESAIRHLEEKRKTERIVGHVPDEAYILTV